MKPFTIATRGSALALAQANYILQQCQRWFPERSFELKIVKTTGDKLQQASMAQADRALPRGLFTKELEEVLLSGEADLAVHSLKDLPTILPDGLILDAVTEREDVRDVMIYRGERANVCSKGRRFHAHLKVEELPAGAVIGTSSTRRAAQLLALRADLQIVPLRGNVGTRLRKLREESSLDAIVLAAAGLNRLFFKIDEAGLLLGHEANHELAASHIEVDEMLPCVGQAAIGLEIAAANSDARMICKCLNHEKTWHAVTAERAFLRAMGGGCQSPLGAFARVEGNEISMAAVSFLNGQAQRAKRSGAIGEAVKLGESIASALRNKPEVSHRNEMSFC